jgi:hypothetical protein
MSIVEEPNTPARLAERVKAILLRPGATWEAIDAEPATIRGIYLGYVAPLAAIGPVCLVAGQLVFGATGALGLTYRPPVGQVLASALLGWALTLVAVYVLAVAIEFLAPRFGAQKSRLQAFKLAAYSGTAAWVAGVLAIYPPLAAVGSVLGLYSLYLLYLGVPRLLKVTGDKALIYTVCAAICAFCLLFLAGILGRMLLGLSALFTGGFAP